MTTELWITVCFFDFFVGFITGLMVWDMRMDKKVKDLQRQLHEMQFERRLLKEKDGHTN